MNTLPGLKDVFDAYGKERALQEHTREIHRLRKCVLEEAVEIGRLLAEVREFLDHGDWLPWLEREFAWSDRHALNLMNVYEMVSKSEAFSDLSIPISSLYLLAAPNTPESARNEVIEQTKAGKKPSVIEVKEIIKDHKADGDAEASVAKDDGAGQASADPAPATPQESAEPPTPPEPEPAKPPGPVKISKATKRSISSIWNSGTAAERECVKTLAIEEFFTTATGSEIFDRIGPGRLLLPMRAMLDRIGVDGMLDVMGPWFRKELRSQMLKDEKGDEPAPKRDGLPYTTTMVEQESPAGPELTTNEYMP